MFENLTQRLTHTVQRIGGHGRLTERNIQDTLAEVRQALLEADVALPVIKDFIAKVKEQALGQQVLESLSPGQMFIKLVHEQLIEILGHSQVGLDLAAAPPAVILVVGLQGMGKTTSVAKLAQWLVTQEKKQVMVVSTDVYRPAAMQQLATLAEQVGVDNHNAEPGQKPVAIAQQALAAAKQACSDVLIVDSAGRLHVDEDMMAEVREVQQALNPIETLFVVDAMMGQDAVMSAQAFYQSLAFTGVILSKVDGDARGGAALSVKGVTGVPIKFMGVGEKTDALELFYPDRIASRILGMGDVLSLVEEVERKIDQKKADRMVRKMHKGKRFDMNDLLDQLREMKRMGGMGKMIEKLPGFGNMTQMVKQVTDDKSMNRMEALILSMTPNERAFPAIISGSRKKRIARGAGLQIQDLNKLMKQHKLMQKSMKKFGGKGGSKRMKQQMGSLLGMGGLPPMD